MNGYFTKAKNPSLTYYLTQLYVGRRRNDVFMPFSGGFIEMITGSDENLIPFANSIFHANDHYINHV